MLWALPPLPCCSWLQTCDLSAFGAQNARAQGVCSERKLGAKELGSTKGASISVERNPATSQGGPHATSPLFGEHFLFPTLVTRDI